ncbi:MAG TPA: hypothetical protein VHZ51_04885 [Ktedonobacteraceae bacterium]|jgi:hypothetical protein|nr:hypothetical protein [Ktedonobacteraceae bacterium]
MPLNGASVVTMAVCYMLYRLFSSPFKFEDDLQTALFVYRP